MLRTLLIIGFISNAALSSKKFCDTPLRVNVTDGQRHGNVISKQGVTFTSDNYFSENNTTWGCVCDFKRCIRKCCEKNEIMVKNTCQSSPPSAQEALVDFARLNDNATYVFYTNGDYCPRGFVARKKHNSDFSFIDETGSIFINSIQKKFNPETYCVDVFLDEMHEYDIAAVICLERPRPNDVNSCPHVLSVDISDGLFAEDTITKYGVTFESNDYYSSNGSIWGCICNKKTCVRKCCGENEAIMNRTCERQLSFTQRHFESMLDNNSFREDTHHLLFSNGKYCDPHYYTIKERNFEILKNGWIVANGFTLGPEEYCVDTFMISHADFQIAAVLCLKEDEDVRKFFQVHAAGK